MILHQGTPGLIGRKILLSANHCLTQVLHMHTTKKALSPPEADKGNKELLPAVQIPQKPVTCTRCLLSLSGASKILYFLCDGP